MNKYKLNMAKGKLIIWIELNASKETTKKLVTEWYEVVRDLGTHSNMIDFLKSKGYTVGMCEKSVAKFEIIDLSNIAY